jgi:ferrochelatase
VDEVVERGAERVVGVVLSPQWSPLLMSGYVRALADAAAPLPHATSEAWHREHLFVEAVAERLSEALADAGPDAAVLLTAHSLPRRVFDAEPGYVAQLRETAELVAARAGLGPEAWQWAYQSAGHTQEEWLRPDLKELFPALAAAGHREVLVAPVQFVADHLEVLYDLDVAAADDARASGLRYRRVEMPNTNAMFIRALAAVARTTEATIPIAV